MNRKVGLAFLSLIALAGCGEGDVQGATDFGFLSKLSPVVREVDSNAAMGGKPDKEVTAKLYLFSQSPNNVRKAVLENLAFDREYLAGRHPSHELLYVRQSPYRTFYFKFGPPPSYLGGKPSKDVTCYAITVEGSAGMPSSGLFGNSQYLVTHEETSEKYRRLVAEAKERGGVETVGEGFGQTRWSLDYNSFVLSELSQVSIVLLSKDAPLLDGLPPYAAINMSKGGPRHEIGPFESKHGWDAFRVKGRPTLLVMREPPPEKPMSDPGWLGRFQDAVFLREKTP